MDWSQKRALQKRLNRLRCRLSWELEWALGSIIRWAARWRNLANTTSCPCLAVMRLFCLSNYYDDLLWSPYGIGQTIIFSSCRLFFFLLFFPRLISAFADWTSTILPHMVCGLSASLQCMSEMCCTQLAVNTGRKSDSKIAICAPSDNFVGMYLRN